MGTDKNEPWWANDPDLKEVLRRKQEAFERELEAYEPLPAPEADPIPLSPRACLRQLANVRDDLERSQLRYENAIRAGRNAGLSWSQIGRVLGMSKQKLHNRFRERDHTT